MSEPRALVAGHGDYATGIISAVQQITGRGDLLVPVSGAGRSAAEIEEVIRTTMRELSIQVIFTDLQAGSCSMAARRWMRDLDDAVLVCGANLPTLLDFVMTEDLSPREAAARALERGRKAMMLVAPSSGAPPASGGGHAGDPRT